MTPTRGDDQDGAARRTDAESDGDGTAVSGGDSEAAASDGGADPGFDEARLYAVVHRAVEDAILGAVGTLLLVGIAFVLVVGGFQALVSGSPAGVALGVGLVAVGFYLAASALEIVPPVREWF